MKRYLHYLGPSLLRRVLIALLLAFAAVWVTLATYGYWQFTNPAQRDRSLQVYGRTVLAELVKANTAREAIIVVDTASEMFNTGLRDSQMQSVMLVQLNDLQGKTLYLSPESRGVQIGREYSAFYNAQVNGLHYRIFFARTAHWELRLAAPQFNTFDLLKVVIPEMTIQMLIAWVIVVLIISLVVARGLRPLRQLSNLIAHKNKDDLAPLKFASPYAELKPLSAAIDRLLNQLRSKIEREHAFVQDAAHELRTPMAVIAAQAHVLSMAATPAERLVAERNLEQAIARSSHLIAQLLELSHIDNDRLSVLDEIDLAALLQKELAQVAPAAIRRQIELSLDSPDTLMARFDSNAIQSIVQNLLNNAILYIHDGDLIEVTLKQTDDCIVLAVADSGPGISQADQPRIFERFYRGAGHDVAGTGLGLSIVAKAVARLGGTITLMQGLKGRGCKFEIVWPLATK